MAMPFYLFRTCYSPMLLSRTGVMVRQARKAMLRERNEFGKPVQESVRFPRICGLGEAVRLIQERDPVMDYRS